MDLHDRYYPRDIFTGLWERLEEMVTNSRAFVVDEAALECLSDGLATWLKERPSIVVGSQEIWNRATEIVQYVEDEHGVVSVQTSWKGSGKADPFVIAHAEIHDLTVVTAEKHGSTDHPKIPLVCEWRGVPCVNGVDFFRAEGWTFP